MISSFKITGELNREKIFISENRLNNSDAVSIGTELQEMINE